MCFVWSTSGVATPGPTRAQTQVKLARALHGKIANSIKDQVPQIKNKWIMLTHVNQ